MPNKVGAKGQVVIEKEIRDQLGVEPGSVAIQRIVDGHVEIYFLPPPHRRSLYGSLRPYIDPAILERTAKMDWNEIREEAWRAAARSKMELDVHNDE